jgi:hypothetical protein
METIQPSRDALSGAALPVSASAAAAGFAVLFHQRSLLLHAASAPVGKEGPTADESNDATSLSSPLS